MTSVCISPDGRLVAAGSLDTVVRIWDVQTGQLVERLKGHRDSVYSVAFTPDGKGLVSGSLDKTLKYWDVRPILRGREGPGLSGHGVPPSSSGKNGPGGKGDGGGEKGSQCTMNFTGHKDYVLSVAVSHDGKWVVSGSKDRGVQFWDANTAVAQCMLQGHKNSGESPVLALHNPIPKSEHTAALGHRLCSAADCSHSDLNRSQSRGQCSCYWLRGLASSNMYVDVPQ